MAGEAAVLTFSPHSNEAIPVVDLNCDGDSDSNRNDCDSSMAPLTR